MPVFFVFSDAQYRYRHRYLNAVTEYAKTNGADANSKGYTAWWIREGKGYQVSSSGYVTKWSATGKYTVRPAIWIDLSDASLWSYAGKVYSDGTAEEIAPASSTSSGEDGSTEENIKKYDITVTAGNGGTVSADQKNSSGVTDADITETKDGKFTVSVAEDKDLVLGVTPDAVFLPQICSAGSVQYFHLIQS